MKKAIALVFLALYVYNLAGYYVVFKTLQHDVRTEIKNRIKESVPEGDLVLIIVTRDKDDGLQWLDDHEFRYRGGMYDVVRHHSRNDTDFYFCINDKQEEVLFENLDVHVTTQCDIEGLPGKAATPFKGLIKEYIPRLHVPRFFAFEGRRLETPPVSMFAPFTAAVPTPPPRLM